MNRILFSFSIACFAWFLFIDNCWGNEIDDKDKLAQDVEIRIANFEFQDFINTDSRVTIKAKNMERRGKKILGFRSNLIKYSYFEDIYGELNSNKNRVIFKSDYAEWDFKALNVLLLKNRVTLKINGKGIQVKKKAEINFIRSTINIDGNNEVKY